MIFDYFRLNYFVSYEIRYKSILELYVPTKYLMKERNIPIKELNKVIEKYKDKECVLFLYENPILFNLYIKLDNNKDSVSVIEFNLNRVKITFVNNIEKELYKWYL